MIGTVESLGKWLTEREGWEGHQPVTPWEVMGSSCLAHTAITCYKVSLQLIFLSFFSLLQELNIPGLSELKFSLFFFFFFCAGGRLHVSITVAEFRDGGGNSELNSVYISVLLVVNASFHF